MTLARVVADLERRAVVADAEHSTAPVAQVYRLVLAQLVPLVGNGHPTGDGEPVVEDRLLTVAEAAGRLGVRPRWLYAHARDLPFTIRLPGRQLRFRAAGLAAYLGRRHP